MQTIASIQQLKKEKKKISALALYDASFAAMAADAGVEILLVGDSLGMVVQGYKDTLRVRLQDMCYHTNCVTNASGESLVIADMPFASYSQSNQAVTSAAELMRNGAHMIKIEGGLWLQDTIKKLNDNGIPVCSHLGLTPQSVHKFSGYVVQGKTPESADAITQEAIDLERAGASILVLECVPSPLAKVISSELSIPVIGIGAGVDTDGQILVIYDLLGIGNRRKPRFVKNYLSGSDSIQNAINRYVAEVRNVSFPDPEHSYL